MEFSLKRYIKNDEYRLDWSMCYPTHVYHFPINRMVRFQKS